MRNLLVIALCVLCGSAFAGPQYIPFEVSIGTNAAEVKTVTQYPIGYIDEVYIMGATTSGVAVSAGLVTNDISLIVTPNIGSSMVKTVLYTNATLTGAARARPRVTQTDNTGANLSSLTVAERFLCNGDPVAFRVAQSSTLTSLVLKGWLKIDNK